MSSTESDWEYIGNHLPTLLASLFKYRVIWSSSVRRKQVHVFSVIEVFFERCRGPLKSSTSSSPYYAFNFNIFRDFTSMQHPTFAFSYVALRIAVSFFGISLLPNVDSLSIDAVHCLEIYEEQMKRWFELFQNEPQGIDVVSGDGSRAKANAD